MTGSKYLLSTEGKNILIDCGMFQGLKSLRLQNWEPFSISPAKIDAIILTHAHIDHSGYIPVLVKNGFRGKIYSTFATRDLCNILLPDAGYLAEEEAAYLNKHKRTKHNPALPLFSMEAAKASLKYFEPVDFDKPVSLSSALSFELRYVGHILGAASVLINSGKVKIAFTGDIGRLNDPIFFEPKPLPPVDFLVTESTYGNRQHEVANPKDELEDVVLKAAQNKGVVIIPAFAVGRAQEIMFYLWKLKNENRLPNIPVYLNSPMAMNVNALFLEYHKLHKLSESESKQLCEVATYVQSVDESKNLNKKSGPMVIISASGMVSGGRVLHHIKQFGPFSKNIILLTGFQAAGTRGEALEHGADEIKIHGEYIPINAEVRVLRNMSAHADYKEILNWFEKSDLHPKKVFITHGEPSSADALRLRLTDSFGWNCMTPTFGQRVELI